MTFMSSALKFIKAASTPWKGGQNCNAQLDRKGMWPRHNLPSMYSSHCGATSSAKIPSFNE